MSQMKWKQNVEVTSQLLKKIISLQTVSCGNNLPFEQKVIFNIFSKFCVRNLFPRLSIWHWWLPQSCCCVYICPHAGTKWEIHLNALLYSPASESRFTLSHHRFSQPDRLKSVTSRPVLVSFYPDYESTGFLLWKLNGKISEFSFFFPTPERSESQGRAWPPGLII